MMGREKLWELRAEHGKEGTPKKSPGEPRAVKGRKEERGRKTPRTCTYLGCRKENKKF
jgi:hypothetical protein